MNATTTKTIVFITGAFVTHHIWEQWVAYFTSKGYNCIIPPWPYKDGTAQELRNRRPNDTDLAGLRLPRLLSHYTDIINNLPEKPVVIGHSLGGLLVQLLVNKNLVSAGIAIRTMPPKGVFLFEWPFIRSVWKSLGYLTSGRKTYMMGFNRWKHAITNGMGLQEQKDTYEKYAIPESKHVLRGAFTKVAKVDFKKLHPPLLFVSGTADHFTPESLNYNNYLKYDRSHSVTDYKEFQGHNHFVSGASAWREEADYIADWLDVVNFQTVLINN